jgi:proteasome accessory factor C
MTSSETSQTERVLKLITLLKEPRYSAINLARMFNVGRQTIYRDFKLLEDLGYFIDQKDKKHFIFEIDTKITFTHEENYLLHECISVLPENNPLKISIQRKLSSVSQLFPPSGELKDKHLGIIIQKLHIAIRENYQIKLINYQSLNSDELKTRIVIPLKLSSDFAMLSAIENGREKTYKVKRITDVTILYEEQADVKKAMALDIFGCASMNSFSIHILLSKRAYQLFYEEYPSARVHLSKRTDSIQFPFELKIEVQNYAGVGRWCLGLIGELKIIGDEGLRDYLNGRLEVGGVF